MYLFSVVDRANLAVALRIAVFYGSATVAVAFSGLLTFGVFQIQNPKVEGLEMAYGH
jgi:hypothetical protein